MISALSGKFRGKEQASAVGASSEWTEVQRAAAAAEGNNKADGREPSQRCCRYGKADDRVGPQNARGQPKNS